MICNANEIARVMEEIKAVVGTAKNVPGVRMKVSDGIAELSCAVGSNKAILEKIGITNEEGDAETCDIVLNYDVMGNVLSKCMGGGIIIVDDMNIKVNEASAHIKVEQKAQISEEVVKTRGVKEFDIPCTKMGDSVKTALLGRFDFDSMFGIETYATWQSKELSNTLAAITAGQPSQCAFRGEANGKYGFAKNQVHISIVPLECENSVGCAFDKESARAIKDLMSRLSEDKNVRVSYEKDKKAIIVTSDDGNLAAMLPSADVQAVVMQTVKGFEEQIAFDNYELLFRREFLADTIRCVMGSGNTDKAQIEFIESKVSEGETAMNIKVGSLGGSMQDSYEVIIEGLKDKAGDILTKKYNVAIKVINDMINVLSTPYVVFDIAETADGSKYLRIGEIDMAKYIEKRNEAASDGSPISDADEARVRKESLGIRQYAALG